MHQSDIELEITKDETIQFIRIGKVNKPMHHHFDNVNY